MKAMFSRFGIGPWLLAISALVALGAPADADSFSKAGPVKVQVEVIAATAGDIVNSGVPLQYVPFSVKGNIPTNTPENGYGSLAVASNKAEGSLHNYLKAHGKVLYKRSLAARDQKPATILVSEPVKGPSAGFELGGGLPWDMKTVGMRFELGLTSVLEPTRDLQLLDMDTFSSGDSAQLRPTALEAGVPSSIYSLTIDLAGGEKGKDTTVIYVQRLEENINPGESFAIGGLASTTAFSTKGVPLITDGLTSDGGFGSADTKAPVLFVFVTSG